MNAAHKGPVVPLRQTARPQPKARGRGIAIIDLFCGCGGLTLGAMQAAVAAERLVKVDLAVDLNPAALQVYRQNFAAISRLIQERDVGSLVDVNAASKEPSQVERLALGDCSAADLVLAGPPCQGHSDLNNSSRRADPRNLLYLAPARIGMVLRAKAIVIENVPSVTHSLEKVVQRASALLRSDGYLVQEHLVDLTTLGVPQSRKRHLLVATLKPVDLSEALYGGVPARPLRLIDFIEDLQDECDGSADPFTRTTTMSLENRRRVAHLFSKGLFDLPNRFRPPCHRDRQHSYVSMYGRLRPDRPAQTITSGFGSMGQGRFVHPTRPRMITAHEAERIQGFPDSFSFSSCCQVTALREMIGNAVPPQLSSRITGALIHQGHFD